MSMSDAGALVDRLRRPGMRCRTGLLLYGEQQLGREEDLAARLGIEAVDMCQWLLQRIPAETAFVDLRHGNLEASVDELTQQEEPGWDCVCLYNVDIALAKLDEQELAAFWRHMLAGMPYRSRALLLALSGRAADVLARQELTSQWLSQGRLAEVDT